MLIRIVVANRNFDPVFRRCISVLRGKTMTRYDDPYDQLAVCSWGVHPRSGERFPSVITNSVNLVGYSRQCERRDRGNCL